MTLCMYSILLHFLRHFPPPRKKKNQYIVFSYQLLNDFEFIRIIMMKLQYLVFLLLISGCEYTQVHFMRCFSIRSSSIILFLVFRSLLNCILKLRIMSPRACMLLFLQHSMNINFSVLILCVCLFRFFSFVNFHDIPFRVLLSTWCHFCSNTRVK